MALCRADKIVHFISCHIFGELLKEPFCVKEPFHIKEPFHVKEPYCLKETFHLKEPFYVKEPFQKVTVICGKSPLFGGDTELTIVLHFQFLWQENGSFANKIKCLPKMDLCIWNSAIIFIELKYSKSIFFILHFYSILFLFFYTFLHHDSNSIKTTTPH